MTEETFIKVDSLKYLGNVTENGANIEYFEHRITEAEKLEIYIRCGEHCGYCWVSLNEIGKYDTLLNLADNLRKLYGG